jgi:hypothetical protein
MNSNGFFVTGRGYTILSTAALPCRFDIQVGKGLKGQTIRGFASTGKDNPIGFALRPTNTAFTVLAGTENGYDPDTGILTLNAATDDAGLSNTRRVGVRIDNGGSTNAGYFTVEASKNPALTGLGLGTVAARGVNTAGTSIPTGVVTTVVYDAVKSYDTHGALNAATGVFTAPESGYYQASGAIFFNSSLYVATNLVEVIIQKNGLDISAGMVTYPGAFTIQVNSVSTTGVYLNKGDTLSMIAFNNRSAGATLLNTTPGVNYFSVHKTSVGTGN